MPKMNWTSTSSSRWWNLDLCIDSRGRVWGNESIFCGLFDITNRKNNKNRIVEMPPDVKNRKNKTADFRGFLFYMIFFILSYEKTLDFFQLSIHTMRAFKLGTIYLRLSTPEILRFTEQTLRTGYRLNCASLWIKAAHQNSRRDVQTVEFGISKLWL